MPTERLLALTPCSEYSTSLQGEQTDCIRGVLLSADSTESLLQEAGVLLVVFYSET